MKVSYNTVSDIVIFLYFCTILGHAIDIPLLNFVILSILVTLFLFGRCLNFRINGVLKFSPFYLPWIIIWCTYVFLSANWSINPASTENMGKTLVKIFICMLFILMSTDNFDKLTFRIKQVMAASLYMCLKILIAFLGGNTRHTACSLGSGLHFNTVSQIMAFLCIFAFAFLISENKISKKIPWIVYIVIAYIVILWTGSRKSVFIPIIGVFLIIMMGHLGIRKTLRYFSLGLVMVLIVYNVVMSNANLSARFNDMFNALFHGGTDDVSANERGYYREIATLMFLQKPFWGWGAEGFMNYLIELRYSHIAYCHNNYLEILSGLGLIGFTVYYSSYVYMAYKLIRFKDLYNPLGATLLSIIIVLSIFEFGIVSYSFAIYNVLFVFMMIYIKCANMTLGDFYE